MADDTTTHETPQPDLPGPELQGADLQVPAGIILENGALDIEALAQSADFDDWNLDANLRKALNDMGYERPMPVQVAVFNILTGGRDLMVQSKTGSGKTAAFGIPIAQLLADGNKGVQALILAPTRELALQVSKEVEQLVEHMDVSVVPVYGGAPIGPQISKLKAGAQIVAGTPGRVLDHIRRKTLDTSGIRMLVLDECDEMLSMGFQEEIENIISYLPTKEDRQTLLFSATIPKEIERIARRHMRDPAMLSLSSDSVGAELIDHYYYVVSGMARTRDLLKLMKSERPESAIIFCNTREETNSVSRYLTRHGYDAEALSSDLSQADRERVMGRMRAKNLNFLVATDIAARGIDISELSHVINYTFPSSPEVYVHRTGRTGRAGKQGTALSLVGPREIGAFYYLKLIYKIIPTERELPTADEMATIEEGEQYEKVVKMLEGKPRSEYLGLARRLWQSNEGERVVGLLLQDLMTRQAESTKIPVAAERVVDRTPTPAATIPERAAAQPAEPVVARSEPAAPARASEATGPEEGEEQPRRKRRRRRRSEEEQDETAVETRAAAINEASKPVHAAPRLTVVREPVAEVAEELAAEEPADEVLAAPVDAVVEQESDAGVETAAAESASEAQVVADDGEDAGKAERPRRKRRRRRGAAGEEAEDMATERAERSPRVVDEDARAAEPAQELAKTESKSSAGRSSKAPVTKTPAAKAAKRRPRKPAVDPGAHVEFWEAWAETKSSDSSAPAADEEDESPELVAAAPASEAEDGTRKKRRRRTRKPRGSEAEESEDADASAPMESAADEAGEKVSETDSEAGDPGSVRLFVNVGKREDADADEIMAFLSEAVGDKAEGLGRITLRNTHCYVRVDSDIADEVIEACTGLVFKEREMVVERAKR